MRYWVRETVELVLNEGSDLEEFVPVDLEADSSDSDNSIFIFIIGIRATSRIKLLLFLLCLDSSRFAVGTEKGI